MYSRFYDIPYTLLFLLCRSSLLKQVRVVPDIRPFLIFSIRSDIRFHLSDIRLAGYRISGIRIHEIVDIASCGIYFV